jgi:hypothetical protein
MEYVITLYIHWHEARSPVNGKIHLIPVGEISSEVLILMRLNNQQLADIASKDANTNNSWAMLH